MGVNFPRVPKREKQLSPKSIKEKSEQTLSYLLKHCSLSVLESSVAGLNPGVLFHDLECRFQTWKQHFISNHSLASNIHELKPAWLQRLVISRLAIVMNLGFSLNLLLIHLMSQHSTLVTRLCCLKRSFFLIVR